MECTGLEKSVEIYQILKESLKGRKYMYFFINE